MHTTTTLLLLCALALLSTTTPTTDPTPDPYLAFLYRIGQATTSCQLYFEYCRQSTHWPETRDLARVQTEECWPRATLHMRGILGDKTFLCPRRIYPDDEEGSAEAFPPVSEEVYRLYAREPLWGGF
ncbi:MAG: hypothetical protein M1829_003921 [Trizodia sp. TS-e1964]|nr:MAG: hypothetical protein M1829_003921 [Trizodia sp. TS-e1964]